MNRKLLNDLEAIHTKGSQSERESVVVSSGMSAKPFFIPGTPGSFMSGEAKPRPQNSEYH